MKILYVGQINHGSTCFDRMACLKRLGYLVVGFNVTQFASTNRIFKSLQSRFKIRWLLEELNKELRRLITVEKFDCVWIDKGIWISGETCSYIKSLIPLLIHYTPDFQIMINKSNLFFESIPYYDFLVTTKSHEYSQYLNKGAKKVILVNQSFCPERYRDIKIQSHLASKIGFVGRAEKHYKDTLMYLGKHFEGVRVFGSQWKRFGYRGPYKVEGGLWEQDYVNGLASFDIGLGLLSKLMPEMHTTRSFEIPAAGSFLLAERTPEHEAFFEDGKEAVFYSTLEELVDKASYYLKHKNIRQRIAASGFKRCWSSGYDNDSVIRHIFREINI